MLIRDVVDVMKEWFPLRLAEEWDNVGLLLGDDSADAKRIMTCLTVTAETAAEALREKVDLIISHHPILFRKVQRLTASGSDRHVYSLARGGVSVFSPHTAFDGAAEGINQQIAERIGLSAIRPLRSAVHSPLDKLIVYLPESDLEPVSSAIFRAGGGHIGEYSQCSYRTLGTGTFLGSERSNPTIGVPGRREEVSEFRFEVIVPRDRTARVVAAMLEAHSYEVPAYDVLGLSDYLDGSIGAGRLGELPTPCTLDELARRVQTALGALSVDVVGMSDRECRRVAIGCGAAGEFLRDAASLGCDAFLTGEARFHDALAARDLDLGLLLAGHYATERFALETLAERLSQRLPELEIWASRDESDPIRRIS